MKKHKMYLVLGDWSDDGHGKMEKVLLETNLPVKDIQDAYKASCKLTGVSFHGNNGIATEYESGFDITQQQLERLQKYGFNPDLKVDEYHESFMDHYDTDEPSELFTLFWLDFVKLSLPNLEAKIIGDKVPNINGYWDENLNEGFGYGLY